jgi:hypothetical protein
MQPSTRMPLIVGLSKTFDLATPSETAADYWNETSRRMRLRGPLAARNRFIRFANASARAAGLHLREARHRACKEQNSREGRFGRCLAHPDSLGRPMHRAGPRQFQSIAFQGQLVRFKGGLVDRSGPDFSARRTLPFGLKCFLTTIGGIRIVHFGAGKFANVVAVADSCHLRRHVTSPYSAICSKGGRCHGDPAAFSRTSTLAQTARLVVGRYRISGHSLVLLSDHAARRSGLRESTSRLGDHEDPPNSMTNPVSRIPDTLVRPVRALIVPTWTMHPTPPAPWHGTKPNIVIGGHNISTRITLI